MHQGYTEIHVGNLEEDVMCSRIRLWYDFALEYKCRVELVVQLDYGYRQYCFGRVVISTLAFGE